MGAGTGPPVAQSSSSAVYTIGRAVPTDLRQVADVAGRDHVGPGSFDVRNLPIEKLSRIAGCSTL